MNWLELNFDHFKEKVVEKKYIINQEKKKNMQIKIIPSPKL